MYTESILGTSVLESTSTTESSTDLSDTEFMTLLIAQLENQDPLDPLSNTDMLGQLAEFANLEQLTSMNSTLESMAEQFNAQIVNSAVSFIGLDVMAEGDTITKGDDGVSDITYTLSEEASTATAYIYDEDDGLVASVSLSDLEAGDHSFTWDGLDSDGNEMADGTYYVTIGASDADGDVMSVSTMCQGTVVGLTTQNGDTVFELDDGRYVDIMAVSRVYTSSAN